MPPAETLAWGMKDWTSTLVGPDATIRSAIEAIDKGALRVALVVDQDRRLRGLVTDGDIRRGILRGISLEDPVTEVMNAAPKVVQGERNREQLVHLMTSRGYQQLPILDEDGRVIGIDLLDDLIQPETRPNPVVLMAGGLGTRLRPLTEDCPKPMLRVGAKPILETIIEHFRAHGFRRFYVSVNYKADMITDHFGDGSQWGVSIEYLHEPGRLGTAGSLSLLPERPQHPVLVMNGDVLTKINVNHLLDYHHSHRAVATMGVGEYHFQVPYGVVQVDHHQIVELEEKPIHRALINAGIYVLEPHALDHIPPGTFFDMPTLFNRLIELKHETAAFPIREYWMDIGRHADFDRAQGEFHAIFGDGAAGRPPIPPQHHRTTRRAPVV